jgi:hypothetical protein
VGFLMSAPPVARGQGPALPLLLFSVFSLPRTVAIHMSGTAKVFYCGRLTCGVGGANYER